MANWYDDLSGDDITQILTLIGGMATGATAPKGGQTVTQNTSTTNLPGYMQQGAQGLWDQFVDDFYGLSPVGNGKTYKQMYLDDTSYRAKLDKSLSDTFTGQNEDINAGRGLFTPTNVSFGGQKGFSFVPRSNRDLGATVLKNATTSTALQSPHGPNEGDLGYSDILWNKILGLNPNQSNQQTQTATLPSTSTYANILQGANTGIQLGNAITSNNSNVQSTVTDQDGNMVITLKNGKVVTVPKSST
jgi:hypothetical protein